MDAVIMINLPQGNQGQVDISIGEIAAMREHTVVSYGYEKWTEITLKSGEKFDCKVPLNEVRKKIQKVQEDFL